MFCTSCNADIGTRLPNFCPQCGVPLQADNLLEFVSPAPATATQDDDATVLLPPRKAAKTSRKPTAATSAPDEDTTVLLPPHGAAKAPQDLIDALLAPDDDSTALAHETAETPQEPTAATSAPDNDATVLLPPRGAAKAPQDPLDALLAPDDDSSVLTHEAAETPQESADATSAPDDDATVLLPPRGAAKAPQDPLDALLAPDEDSTALAHEAAETPQEPADATSIPDNSPTVQLFSRLTPGLLQNSTPAPPSQPDASINASTAPTMAISGSNTKRRKKKPKKARGRAQSSAPKPLIEPFIGATQAEPVSPFNKPEPSLSTESFPPVFPEKSDRIVVEPLYPGSSPYPGSLPYPGSSRIPTQVIRESIPPAAIGLAAIILIVFLGGLWWWNSGETVSFPEDVGEPPPMSEPLPKAVSSPPPSTPASPAENTAAFSPEEQPPGLESGLMSIPSLPANQQQGRHNQYNPATTKDDPLPSVSPAPMPAPATPAPPPAQRRVIAAPPEPVAAPPEPVAAPPESARMPEPAEKTPAEMPEFAEAATHNEIDDTPAPAPRVAAPRQRQQAAPPWLGQMRNELLNCESLFCRERVRRRYCSDQWEGLPECRGASL